MVGQTRKTARTIAMVVLNQFNRTTKHSYVGQILDKFLQQTNEKQRATDLVFGTIRNRTAIDTVIAELADCPTDRIPTKLLNIIRIGTYELIYCPKTAEYAIVNEAVKNAKTIAGKKQAGFTNAVLRQITRRIQNRQVPLSQADIRKTLPQMSLTGCEFDSDVLPDPKTSPADYLSGAFSLPKWLVSDWLTEFGLEKVRQICFASNRRPSIYIRPNTLKTTIQEIAKEFHQADVEFEIVADKSMLKIKAAQAIAELPGFAEGLFSVQDITASEAVRLLRPQPGWKILDLCAAPGGKTTQLAELTEDKAKIIATDIDSKRLEKVKENTTRLGINSVNIIAYGQLERTAAEIGPFDCVLLDVPCSNTGVLAKRPEARYRIRRKIITEVTRTQRQLLETVATMIKPGGKICYSTCSIQKDENSELVRDFLLQNRSFKLKSENLTLPSAQEFDHDGGYVAIIVKSTKPEMRS